MIGHNCQVYDSPRPLLDEVRQRTGQRRPPRAYDTLKVRVGVFDIVRRQEVATDVSAVQEHVDLSEAPKCTLQPA